MQFNHLKLPDLALKNDIYTTLREIDLLLSSVYKTGESGFDEVIKTQINSDLHDAVIDNFKNNNCGESQKDKTAILTEMRDALTKVSVLRLELAITPSKQLIATIQKWTEKNLNEKVVLDLSCNERLIAGAKITFEGKYADESLLNHWPEIWARVRKKPGN